jgi:hypothetical protein
MISESTVVEFQDALNEEYGKDVTFQEASQMLSDLVTYFDVLMRIEGRDPIQVDAILNYNKNHD